MSAAPAGISVAGTFAVEYHKEFAGEIPAVEASIAFLDPRPTFAVVRFSECPNFLFIRQGYVYI